MTSSLVCRNGPLWIEYLAEHLGIELLFVQLDALDRVERYGFVKPRRGQPTITLAQKWISEDR